ncbi:MAG: tetratricopeptide repeat protein [Acidobacteria bacterium]|nr:tetratricopeptide repeat protein [Acidobacteriota bacterium]
MKSALDSFVICAAVTLLAGLVYLSALHNPFVYDDYHTVVANPSIQDMRNLRALLLHDVTRPFISLSYAVDRALWGSAPFGFHVTNVLLHMINVVLLFQLARRFSEDQLVAFSAAALFAVHPMMTEAVGYISGRSEVLCATWFLAALLCGRRWLRGGGARWGVLTVGFWIVALATKETAAMFPFVFAAYDWLTTPEDEGEKRRRMRTVHLPLVGTAVAAGVVRLAVLARIEYPGQVAVHWPYILLDLDVVRRYVSLMLTPNHQTIFHDVTRIDSVFDPRALLAAGVVGVIVAVAWRLRRVEWLASFGIVWFLLSLVPSAVLIALDQGEPMTEHRVYLASCGLFLTVGAAIGWIRGRVEEASVSARSVASAALALVLMAFAAETVVRNAVWADPVKLWRESVDLAPNHYRPRLLLGEALLDKGRRDEAMEQFRIAIRLRPTDSTAYVKLGRCLADVGQFAEARRLFLKAVEIEPRSGAVRQMLGALDRMEVQLKSDDGRR